MKVVRTKIMWRGLVATAGEDAVRIDRELGILEQVFAQCHAIGGAFQITGVLRFRGYLPVPILAQALEIVRQRHPLLSVCLDKVGTTWRWRSEPNASVPLQVRPRQTAGDWIDVAEAETAHPLCDTVAPLCRCTYLRAADARSGEIILTIHHAICDGRSGLTALRELVATCQALLEGRSQGSATPFSPVAPVEALINSRFSWRVLGTALWQRLRHHVIRPRLLPMQHLAAPAERRSLLVARVLQADATARLVQRLAVERVSLQGVLCAAALLAIREMLPGNHAIPLNCASMVDLRRLLRPPVARRQVGCFASAIETLQRVKVHTPVWELARLCQQGFPSALTARRAVDAVRTMGSVVRQQQRIRMIRNAMQIHNGRRHTLMVVHMGRSSMPSSPRLQVTGVHGIASQHVLGSCVWLSSIMVARQLHLTFVLTEPVMQRATAHVLADAVVSRLMHA